MEDHDKYIAALIRLHGGLDRQGPGDDNFSNFILDRIPELPPNPRIADLGCGAGAGALILAERFRSGIKAVDLARAFLDQLSDRAIRKGLAEYIEIIECDIGNLGWDGASVDLLWSEGAAYTITFRGALEKWRPLLAAGGIAVISEMNYFSAKVPESLIEYMETAYPGIKTESDNLHLIDSSGFEVLGVHRLPSKAWWDNYYDPLREKMNLIGSSGDGVLQAVIRETQEEMDFFAAHDKDYGYTYFIMRAI